MDVNVAPFPFANFWEMDVTLLAIQSWLVANSKATRVFSAGSHRRPETATFAGSASLAFGNVIFGVGGEHTHCKIQPVCTAALNRQIISVYGDFLQEPLGSGDSDWTALRPPWIC